MAGRVEPADSLEYFPTPPWAVRALFPLLMELAPSQLRDFELCEEPACGEGIMAEVLGELFSEVFAADIFPYGYGDERDYLGDDPRSIEPDWTITNPPFSAALAFIQKALSLSRVGVAMLTRLQFLEGQGRWRDLWSANPPSVVAIFTDRVAMTKGEWRPGASTATAYCWIIWVKDRPAPTQFRWIEPGRKHALTHPDDARRFARQVEAPLLEVRS